MSLSEEHCTDNNLTDAVVLFVLSANCFLKQNPICGKKSVREAF